VEEVLHSAGEDGKEALGVQEVWQDVLLLLLLYDVGARFLVLYAEIWDVEVQEGVQDELVEE